MATTIVRGGTVVTESGVFQADIVIRAGLIASLTSDASDLLSSADEVIDATGLMGLAARPVSAVRLLGLAVMAVGVFLSQRG